jgi:hypothetical protein
MPALSEDDDRFTVYERALRLLEEGSAVAIITVEDETHQGLFAVGHDFTDAPHLKATCYHANARRRALAAFAMVRFARKTARTDGFQPVP